MHAAIHHNSTAGLRVIYKLRRLSCCKNENVLLRNEQFPHGRIENSKGLSAGDLSSITAGALGAWENGRPLTGATRCLMAHGKHRAVRREGNRTVNCSGSALEYWKRLAGGTGRPRSPLLSFPRRIPRMPCRLRAQTNCFRPFQYLLKQESLTCDNKRYWQLESCGSFCRLNSPSDDDRVNEKKETEGFLEALHFSQLWVFDFLGLYLHFWEMKQKTSQRFNVWLQRRCFFLFYGVWENILNGWISLTA